MDYRKEYERWVKSVEEEDLRAELESMEESSIEDAFYRDLAFGTGGLRGIIGAGTNRMNVYVVAKASQGLANYLLRKADSPSVVIGYDSRIKSDLFAKTAAGVFAANGIRVHIWPELSPVPTVSFAIRYLKASEGVMITASHNPSEYNGYKVYGSDGCQITTNAAESILSEIKVLDLFVDIKKMSFEKGIQEGRISFIEDAVMDAYTEEVKRQSVLFGDEIDKNLAIVYSPLNGTGFKPVTRVLNESGFSNITFVEEQRDPDGSFPTCPYPNPEIQEAMELGLRYCEKSGADLLLATDPDADRCGIAVKNSSGTYLLLSGNEVGLLLLDYICGQRTKHGSMPEHPVFIKTIVTSNLAEKIAEHYGVETRNVLTGFKYIGEQIGYLEKQGKEDDFVFGFEESYGYLSGSYVRDKDAVNAAFLIAEMFAFYKTRDVTLTEKLEELYKEYGYCLNKLHFFEFPGSAGMKKMRNVMDTFRKEQNSIGKERIIKTEDYSTGLYGLPKSDVIKYYLNNGSVVIRPSGTEPKLKVYISILAEERDKAADMEKNLAEVVTNYIVSFAEKFY